MEEKNARQKRPFFRFFELWLQNFWMLLPLNFISTVLRVVLIPCGLAQVGITNITRNLARDKHSFGISDYFDTIKANWKRALPMGLLNLVVNALLCYGMLFYYNSEGFFADLALGLLILCFVVFAFMRYYMWTLLVTFDLSAAKIYKNSFLLAFVNLKGNLFLGVIQLILYGGSFLLLLRIPHFLVLFLITILVTFIFPGFFQLLVQFNTFHAIKKYMIDPYYEAHPEADTDLRRSLSLETGEPAEEKPEPVFRDEE